MAWGQSTCKDRLLHFKTQDLYFIYMELVGWVYNLNQNGPVISPYSSCGSFEQYWWSNEILYPELTEAPDESILNILSSGMMYVSLDVRKVTSIFIRYSSSLKPSITSISFLLPLQQQDDYKTNQMDGFA